MTLDEMTGSNKNADAVPGLIMVPMSLHTDLSVSECDDWYNNEHVPIRMKLPFFARGYRYYSIENDISGPNASELPHWLALYDIYDMWQLTQERYARLLRPSVQSARENGILARLSASRKYFDLVSEYVAPDFTDKENHMRRGSINSAYRGTLIIVGVKLTSDFPDAEKEWNRWYEEDHLPPLRKVPGWQRTRRYRTSVIEDITLSSHGSATEYLTLNEFTDDAKINGPEHQLAIRTEVRTNVVSSKWRHSFKLHYVQGSASRDLLALRRDTGAGEAFISPDGLTKTCSGLCPSIESYLITRDSMIVTYRLEGAVEGDAPLVVLCSWPGVPWNLSEGLVSTLQQRQRHDPRFKCKILRLTLPIRVGDTNYALSHFTSLEIVAHDLEDSFEALLMNKVAILLIVGLGGTPVDLLAPKVCKSIHDQNIPQALQQTCSRGGAIVCDSPEGLQEFWNLFQTMTIQAKDLGSLGENIIRTMH